MITINFDMDGTIADFYNVDNWLSYLLEEKTFPYENANALLNLSVLARYLNKLQRQGFRLGIITWLAPNSSDRYEKEVAQAKLKWLRKHLNSVHFDDIHIVPYGTPKQEFCSTANDILFDDDERNRNTWTGKSYEPSEILSILRSLN